MTQQVTLSKRGSDRATAYEMSAKILRRPEALCVAWLDAPRAKGEPAKIRLGFCDPATGDLRRTLTLGDGIDNHCGPALAEDVGGRVHLVTGHHHGPFLYRWSDRPDDEAAWSAPEPLGPFDTYPSLAVDAGGTLHLAHRERAERWQLWYRRRPKGGPWESPVAIATSPTPGYNHYMQSLTVGPTGTVHLTFQFHYAESGKAIDCKGRAAVYLRSEDGGRTWRDQEGGRIGTLPITIASMRPICDYPDAPDRHAVRVGNHVVDAKDRPWLYCSLADAESGGLFQLGDRGWIRHEMAARLDGLKAAGGRSTALSRAPDGGLHLLLATSPDGRDTGWFDASHEIFHLAMDAAGGRRSFRQVTKTDGAAAHWLPSIEAWDWTRREKGCGGGHWFTYTRGLNAGGIGGDNKSAVRTEVVLGRL